MIDTTDYGCYNRVINKSGGLRNEEKITRFAALLFAVAMTMSTATFAAHGFVSGEVVVRLKDGVEVEASYESLFPEVEIERVVMTHDSFDNYSGDIVLVLKDHSAAGVQKAIDALKDKLKYLVLISNFT